MTQPLASLKILDLTRLLPGPLCTLFFADFGAEVIKIEDPFLGDYSRWIEPKLDENSALFHSLNRNKKSVTINLKSEKGRRIFLEMVKDADILIESFRPGVMDKLNLSYSTLKEYNSKLIYCAITGFGQDGPYAANAGHDLNFISYAGLLGLGKESNQPPSPPSFPVADIAGGSLIAAIGIFIALQDRAQTGIGRMVDISMLDGTLSLLQTVFPSFLATQGNEADPSNNKAGYRTYETGDGRFIAVGAVEPKFWKAFCTGIGRPDLAEENKFAPERQDGLVEEISRVMKQKSLADWMRIFENIDACVSPVLNLDEVVMDPQIRHRKMFMDVEHSTLGTIKQLANPIKILGTDPIVPSLAPNLGEHNEEIFNKLSITSD